MTTSCRNCGNHSEHEFVYCPRCGSKAVGGPGAEDSLLGRVLNDKYRVVSEIGTGAMGTVYLGEHIGLKKRVALKVLHRDLQVSEESLQRFQREGIAAGQLNHRNGIQIFDFDKAEGIFYLAMEFVEGDNLKIFLRKKGRLAPAPAVDLIRQVLSVLDEAHRHGIVHRDLKPDNIMVMPSASGEHPIKVLDFGLSKLVDVPMRGSLQTQVGRILGTPLYMAPEQCAGEEADARSDLYAVGLILYELLVGVTPFPDESTTEILFTRPKREAPSITDSHPDLGIPPALDDVLRRALERQREARYQSAAEMLADLEAASHGAPPRAARKSGAASRDGTRRLAGPTAAGAASRSRLPVAVLAGVGLLVVLVVLGASWIVLGGGGGEDGGEPVRVSMKVPAELDEGERRYLRHLQDAREALRAQDEASAMAAVTLAAGAACADSEAFLVRAQVFRARDDDEAALLDFQEALRLDESYASAAAGIGWIRFDRGELDLALGRFEQAAELDAGSAEALAGQSAVWFRRGDLVRARELSTRAIELDAGSATAQLYHGHALLESGDVEAAVGAFNRAKRADPLSWRVYAALGEAYLVQGRAEDAEKQLDQALSLNPDAVDVRVALASLHLDAARFTTARSLLEPGLEEHPDSARMHVLLGIARHGLGDADGAIESLGKGLAHREGDAKAHTLLGILHQQRDELAEAMVQYERARRIDDSLVLPTLNQGLVLFELRRIDEALETLGRVLELDAGNALAHLLLGILYMDYAGDLGRAAHHFREYEELDGSDPRVPGWLRRIGY